jgi:hypothetical protein
MSTIYHYLPGKSDVAACGRRVVNTMLGSRDPALTTCYGCLKKR